MNQNYNLPNGCLASDISRRERLHVDRADERYDLAKGDGEHSRADWEKRRAMMHKFLDALPPLKKEAA